MFLKKIITPGKKERGVLQKMTDHLQLLCSACKNFKEAVRLKDNKLMAGIIDQEREGDIIKRSIIAEIYEGAFLPYLRPDLCRFTETTDQVFDLLEDAALQYMDSPLVDSIRDDCLRVARLNLEISEMLLITFEAMQQGEDLREKTLAIRIYEKKIDNIKFELIKSLRKIEITNFWDGKVLSDFVTSITTISDVIEDASELLQIINLSLK